MIKTSDLFPSANSLNPKGLFTFLSRGQETVQSLPLSEILMGEKEIDFFSLDVEGYELKVLETMDWSIPVKVWLIENHLGNPNFHKVRNLLSSKGYVFAERIHWNDVFVRKGIHANENVKYVFKDNSDYSTHIVVAVLVVTIIVLILCCVSKFTKRAISTT